MGSMNTIEEKGQLAYDQAIRWLTRRAYGERELENRLQQSGFATEAVAQACARCRELGYLDDAAFALSRARYRLHHGHYGPRRVWAELRALQVDDEYIQQALDFLLAETDSVSLAEAALSKQFGAAVGRVAGEPDQTGRRDAKRRYDFLARRGFNDETIWQVLR